MVIPIVLETTNPISANTIDSAASATFLKDVVTIHKRIKELSGYNFEYFIDTVRTFNEEGLIGDPTILKQEEIGVTIQPFDPNIVIDGRYVATENSYTTDEKNKLATIAPGAEVNVNADWTATSGSSQILNKPTLGTAAATDQTEYATSAQGTLADNSVQKGDSISYLSWSSTNW